MLTVRSGFGGCHQVGDPRRLCFRCESRPHRIDSAANKPTRTHLPTCGYELVFANYLPTTAMQTVFASIIPRDPYILESHHRETLWQSKPANSQLVREWNSNITTKFILKIAHIIIGKHSIYLVISSVRTFQSNTKGRSSVQLYAGIQSNMR